MIQYLYNEEYFRAGRKFFKDVKRNQEFVDFIKTFNPKSVLDVGCGTGTLVKLLRDNGIEAYGIDFAPILKEKYWKEHYCLYADAKKIPFEDNAFDIVVSSDFFEHIPEEEIDTVYNEMKRVGNKIIARIAFEDKLTEKQKLYHCTNKPKSWWIEKLPNIIFFDYETGHWGR